MTTIRVLPALLVLAGYAAAEAPPTLTTLHNFNLQDGSAPSVGLAIGADYVLYGASSSGGDPPCRCGTVFSLAPPASAGGAWTEKVLYSFTGGSDGGYPTGNLAIGANHVLYGVASTTVFSLTPPAGDPSRPGAWTESIVYNFGPGVYLSGGGAIGEGGVLYGATSLEEVRSLERFSH
jgi:hypothetical protein